MAITNHERIGKMLDFLADGLKPFVERELVGEFGANWARRVTEGFSSDLQWTDDSTPHLDIAAILRIMWDQWNLVFGKTLGRGERSIVSELRDVRNKWAHQNPFSSDDAYRALDSASRLLTAVSAVEADPVEKMKQELLRLRFDEQVRSEKRKTSGSTVESQVTGTLKPWREVVSPHPDVASGRYQQAEFAADLWQVHLGEGAPEYVNPTEFFRRTYMTESLTRLLVDAIRRLSGESGDPVVQLQTNFGGGKTHSMLALYHMVAGKAPGELLGIDAVLKASGIGKLPVAKQVVLVGNKISPGNPSQKADGTVVHTLWGELAYQLGGRAAYETIRNDDERATNPGDRLREILNEHGPSLILIDEWVAYARQLHDSSDLPAGSFETQFSFAQALTESAKLAKNCLLVIRLPAIDTPSSPHAQGDDIEVGGQRGREALDRLRNVIGRVEASWRPASAEEGFEIVRRRLFEPLIEQEQFKSRDFVASTFYDLYRTQHQEFPQECRNADYEQRLRAAYPIHPEVFERLYTDWSTLPKFQRTRGVLRLMAAVIHSLWEKGDRNPLIMPCNLPIDDDRVRFELTRYLPDQWEPIIAKDVDGPNALPLRIDGEIPNLGKAQACRRVARTIYLGSAPTTAAANRGLEDRRVKLGCVMPGEQAPIFGDALRRLAGAATYLYQDGSRYWYSTQPTVTKLAEDRAEQFRRNPDAVAREIEQRIRLNIREKGEFSRIHDFPQSGGDVQDDLDARLVVLGIEHPYIKEEGNAAESFAKEILRSRGNAPRIYQNTLVFLAVDKTKLQDLDDAVRRYLAWESILGEQKILNLDPHQVRQAENQKTSADSVVVARIPEAYQWLLVPVQDKPGASVEWNSYRLNGQEALAVRASRKLKNDELLLTSFAPSRLKMELDRTPLWRENNNAHVAVKKVAEDFAQFLFLPRLRAPGILLTAIQDGVKLLTWAQDSFAYADSYDEVANRYRSLVCGRVLSLGGAVPEGLLVRSDVAIAQLDAEVAAQSAPSTSGPQSTAPQSAAAAGPNGESAPVLTPPTRYHGSIKLDPTRVGRDASRVAEEVISHLSGLLGADVQVTLEIAAVVPNGTSDDVVRIVTQNCRDLKFETHGFEQ
jgi:predicted AAA+ superfamily ATPase